MNIKETIELFKAMQQPAPGITLSLPGATVYANDAATLAEAMKSVPAPVVTNNITVPEAPVADINIQNNVQPADVQVFQDAPDLTPVADAMKAKPEPRLRKRKEKATVARGKKGDMLGTETVSTYMYDDEE